MRPLVVLLGIVMGSTVSIALALVLTGVVFLLAARSTASACRKRAAPLALACLLSVSLAAIAATSFYGELRLRAWRLRGARGAGRWCLAYVLWTYWPKK